MTRLPPPTPEEIKEKGMVFTPPDLVKEMLDRLPESLFTENKTFLDHSCGRGAFLISVVLRKIKAGYTHKEALSTTFGIELCPKNAADCRKRLMAGSRDLNLAKLLARNIRCADALNPDHPGWEKVGYMWSNLD